MLRLSTGFTTEPHKVNLCFSDRDAPFQKRNRKTRSSVIVGKAEGLRPAGPFDFAQGRLRGVCLYAILAAGPGDLGQGSGLTVMPDFHDECQYQDDRANG